MEREADNISIGGKTFVALQKAMQALLYDYNGIEKCVKKGMPKIIYKENYYFCLEDCHKWHAGK